MQCCSSSLLLCGLLPTSFWMLKVSDTLWRCAQYNMAQVKVTELCREVESRSAQNTPSGQCTSQQLLMGSRFLAMRVILLKQVPLQDTKKPSPIVKRAVNNFTSASEHTRVIRQPHTSGGRWHQ